jgi:hypothetical protein
MSSEKEFDPSLHILPLDPETNAPVYLLGEKANDSVVVGFTTDGRISFFPVETETFFVGRNSVGKTVPLTRSIGERINIRFPKNKDIYGNSVRQYLVAAVMYGKESERAAFIFEVWGFREPFRELEILYENLLSIGGCKVGDERYTTIQEYFSSEPVKAWINELISFLKQQLGWSNYVRNSIDSVFYNQ